MKSYSDYFYPGTDTLKNKLNIRDSGQLEAAERQLTFARLAQPIDSPELSPEGLKRMHHHLFQDLYPWAGQFRTVDMQKVVESGPNVHFAPAMMVARVEIPRFFRELNSDLNDRNFDNLDPETFSYRAAVYIADLNHIHPFPEGNGRTQRFLLGAIAQRAGYQVDQTKIDRNAWIAGAIDSSGQDRDGEFGPHRVMTGVIERAISPIQRLTITEQKNDIGDEFLAADVQTRLADPRLRNAQLQLQVGLRVAEREAGRSINEMPELAAKLVATVSEQLRAGKVFEAPRIIPDQGNEQSPEIKPPTL